MEKENCFSRLKKHVASKYEKGKEEKPTTPRMPWYEFIDPSYCNDPMLMRDYIERCTRAMMNSNENEMQ